MKDSKGCLVGDPLKQGVGFCRIHLQTFQVKPARVRDPLLFFLDFETSGLDILTDHIVEIGVLSEHSECFSTVICSPLFNDGPTVHGILEEELRAGPSFVEAFQRLFRFFQNIAECAVVENYTSEDEEVAPSVLKEAPPDIVIVAHNGIHKQTRGI